MDWTTLTDGAVWPVFWALVVIAIVIAGLSQTVALAHVRASFSRHCSVGGFAVAVGASWLLLGEQLRSAWQVAGVTIVMITVTLYVAGQSSVRHWLTDQVRTLLYE